MHSGISNSRQKEPDDDRESKYETAVTSLRDAAPGCKCVMSKLIPVVDHNLDIERTMFNAIVEKKLAEIDKSEISFLDNGNLADQGEPVKHYYRQDLIHMKTSEVEVFADDICRSILKVLNRDVNI